MGYRFDPAAVRFLSGPAGPAALAQADRLPLSEATWLTDLTRLRRILGDQATAVAETVRLRRRAVRKLGPGAAGWLLTDEALQQATPLPVAEHRAGRLRGAGVGVHDLTCSVGADLVPLTSACRVAIGSDLDAVRVAMAAHNLRVAGRPVRVAVADALRPVSRGLLGYADPSRRDGAGRRIPSVDTRPGVTDLDAAHARRPPVLRMPPGIDYESLDRPGEVEVVSLDGGVREAVLWPPELAAAARRATVLRSARDTVGAGAAGAQISSGAIVEQLTSDDPDDAALTGVQDWIVDPDPAIVRAHLVRHYAARHGLALLDPRLAYLTGPAAPPGVRAFRVLDAAPFRERTVAEWIRRDRVGTLEIKQRGTPLVPDEVRRRLRPALRGPTSVAATLVVARIGRGAQAFWCRAAG